MSPEVDPQNSSDEHYFEVTGADDGRTPEAMEDFIKGLNESFEYPALATLNLEPDPAPELDPSGPLASDEPEEDSEEEEEVPETPPATPSDHVLINGQEVPLSDVQRLYEFDQYLRSNPDAAERVQAAVKPTVPAAPAPPTNETLTPPEFLDLEDPAQKFMWDSYVRTQTDLAAIKQRDEIREQSNVQARATADMDQALAQWTAAHPNFNDDQIIAVRKHAAEMNVIGSLMATSSSPVAALARAMDLAALDNPDLRSIYLDPETHKTQTRKQKQATTKSKLNALGGSSGSAPRTTSTPRPMTDKQARDQFAKELSDSFQNQ
jgi:hypothetical protein